MPSPGEPAASRKTALLNRKAHYYLGLYFLFFVWLFAFTGLLLNHSGWKFAAFWPQRKTSAFERAVETPPPGTDLQRSRHILRQLGIRGEIEWTASKGDGVLREFRAHRPGHVYSIALDPAATRATVRQIELNTWGVMSVLHAFTGVRAGDAANQRDWILTRVWAFSMDAVCAALILIVLTGIYLWLRLPGRRLAGMLALLAGTAACALFVFGLAWM